uniref:Uncharacterized protein n=1 Tax=viral metagenome TaxID=1070528 RepID=A0A6C0IWF4_9ZZZZ
MAFILGPDNRLPDTCQKWALFDLDWTLIRPTTTARRPTLRGGVYSQWPDDWVIIPGRVERLRDFVKDDFTIGVITNQKSTGQKLEYAMERLRSVRQLLKDELGVEVYFMVSTDEKTMAIPGDSNTLYRKPGTGWGYHLKFLPGSLYVGDAVQDPSRPDRSWGFSDVDRQFAANIGLPFFTPEEAFPQLPLPPELFKIPRLLLILVGPPGSGKSTFARNLAETYGFAQIESDYYGSNRSRIDRAVRDALAQGRQAVVDATNPSRQRRLELIKIAHDYNVPVGIVLFINQGKWIHSPGRNPTHPIASNRYWSSFQEPDPQLEGVIVYYQL